MRAWAYARAMGDQYLDVYLDHGMRTVPCTGMAATHCQASRQAPALTGEGVGDKRLDLLCWGGGGHKALLAVPMALEVLAVSTVPASGGMAQSGGVVRLLYKLTRQFWLCHPQRRAAKADRLVLLSQSRPLAGRLREQGHRLGHQVLARWLSEHRP